MTVKYIYELTKRPGETLYDALRETDFDWLRDGETSFYFEDSAVGKDLRERFVDWLKSHMSARDWNELAQSTKEEDLKDWFLHHPIPGREEDLRRAYSDEEVSFLLSTYSKKSNMPLLLDHLDKSDDAEIALAFNLISYPSVDAEGRYVDTGDDRHLPAEAANGVKTLTAQANKRAEETSRFAGSAKPINESEQLIDEELNALYRQASEIEKKAVLAKIRVEGFECKICGGEPRYPQPCNRSELAVCPSCAHPICPNCANMMENDPMTMEESNAYLDSCDDAAGMAYCGQCGDWSVEFMLRFLKLKGCPIPPEYTHYKARPRSFRLCTTSTVASLQDVEKIAEAVLQRFHEGISGIIKYQHDSGEIWGIPERHEEGWVVTICYPDER